MHPVLVSHHSPSLGTASPGAGSAALDALRGRPLGWGVAADFGTVGASTLCSSRLMHSFRASLSICFAQSSSESSLSESLTTSTSNPSNFIGSASRSVFSRGKAGRRSATPPLRGAGCLAVLSSPGGQRSAARPAANFADRLSAGVGVEEADLLDDALELDAAFVLTSPTRSMIE